MSADADDCLSAHHKNDGRFVWSVNPDADTPCRVGARSLPTPPPAPSPYRIFNRSKARSRAGVVRRLTTGAEPWNVVVSPDGRRAFVANSSQDTISVIDVARERIIGDVNLRAGRCGDPARARHFQPRGLAITRDSRKLYVTSFLACTRPGGKQADDPGARASSAG